MTTEVPQHQPITEDEIIQAIGVNLGDDEGRERDGWYLTKTVKDLNTDPDALDFYRAVLLNGDTEYLKTETKKRLHKIFCSAKIA